MRHFTHTTREDADFADEMEDFTDQQELLRLLNRHRGEQQNQVNGLVTGWHSDTKDAHREWASL
jgi:hypothetical protein